jgi:hypothetical protein
MQWWTPSGRPADFHRSYVSTYLERDLRSQQQVGNLLLDSNTWPAADASSSGPAAARREAAELLTADQRLEKLTSRVLP